ncbi:hypothetical protein [Cupriavidus gilardii]|uniref:hypothetical protein n=1 Tax=Cupriavidus gilardii TaxID=82541 RepID=UPI0015727D1D|nr:hypothetical protein [Cupriavidus gilardii]NSX06944.1 hypothetical protein [Cupriavidus gilardii]
MRISYIPLVMVLWVVACGHAPSRYPGAGGNNLDPDKYVGEQCVNLSGRYEGRGEIIDGDSGALQVSPLWRLDNVFPFANSQQSAALSMAAERDDGRLVYPSEGVVTRESDRRFRITFLYPNGKSGTFTSSFEDAKKYICTGMQGKIVWGGGGLESRSEFGPNRSDYTISLQLDGDGNLILERQMQVHMSLRLGLIPVGTVQHYAAYRFRRLQR